MKTSKNLRNTKKAHSETTRKHTLNLNSYNNNIFKSIIKQSDNTKSKLYGNQEKEFQKEKLMEDFESPKLGHFNLPNQFEVAKDIYCRM